MACLTRICGKEREATELHDIERKRTCTDTLCLLLFFCGWIVAFSILGAAIDKGGDPNRVIRGVDYKNDICGKSPSVENKKLAAWPYPPEWKFKICVATCEETQNHLNFSRHYKSAELLFYCIPVPNATASVDIELSGDFDSIQEDASRAMGDILTAWPVIAISVGMALLYCFVYIVFVRYCAGCLVWTSILMLMGGGFLVSWAFFNRAEAAEDGAIEGEMDNRAKAMKALGYLSAILTFLFIIVILFLRERINIAVKVIKQASEALSDMRLIVFFPFIPMMFGMGFLIFWIIEALWIFSVKIFSDKEIPEEILKDTDGNQVFFDYGVNQTYITAKWDDSLKNSFGFHFFFLLWVVQFLIYLTYLVVAGAVADWYFTPRDENGDKKRGVGENMFTPTPIVDSCGRTMKYHLGSVAFGSLIIAIIRFVRALLAYLNNKAKQAERGGNKCAARMRKILNCCVQCCLKCLECCLDKISKVAFIWIAIYGSRFGTAACSAVRLIFSNLSRVAAITLVGSYLMLLGKILVALVTTGTASIILHKNQKYRDELSSPVMPLVVIFVLAYLVGSLFMAVFETLIDTTFFCFLIDEKFNKPPLFSSKGLQAVMKDHEEKSRQMLERDASLRDLGTKYGDTSKGDVEVLAQPAAVEEEQTIDPRSA